MVETVSKIKNEVLAVVVDPHCFIALPDPDPAFYLNADPGIQTNADPCGFESGSWLDFVFTE
jgi:hypothetical protein